jgi:hypothetical protein
LGRGRVAWEKAHNHDEISRVRQPFFNRKTVYFLSLNNEAFIKGKFSGSGRIIPEKPKKLFDIFPK